MRDKVIYKEDCKRWEDCMQDNPLQILCGCVFGEGEDTEVCDGYVPKEAKKP